MPDLDYFINPDIPADEARVSSCMIAYQYMLFQLMKLYRPAVFGENFYYLSGSDRTGIIATLAASGAISLEGAIKLSQALTNAGQDPAFLDSTLNSLEVNSPDIKVVDPQTGACLQTSYEIKAFIRKLANMTEEQIPLKLKFRSWVISFDPSTLNTIPTAEANKHYNLSVAGLNDIWKRMLESGVRCSGNSFHTAAYRPEQESI